jgi:polysaccharide pyruvyl transferase WcaK-like protein
MEVLVFGFYKKEDGFKGNLGDQVFIEAFKKILPNCNLTFTDHLTIEQLKDKTTIILGGGSFLGNKLPCSIETFIELQTKKIFYVGIGAETEIDPQHQILLQKAKLIITRSVQYDNLLALNSNVMYCPDLMYVLANQISIAPKKLKSILILPNAYLISKWDAKAWSHNAWERFKTEFAQFLDALLMKDYQVDFFPMCQSREINDQYAAIEIIGKMKHPNVKLLETPITTFSELTKLFSTYETITSQRYHGLILADMINVPCLNIWHHDKLKHFHGHKTHNLSYYGIYKDLLIDEFDDLRFIHQNHSHSMAITTDIFKELREAIEALL